MLLSFIIPVFNRPDEINALLDCFVKQTFKNFEVIIIESGSTISSKQVVDEFSDKISVSYFLQGNNGQGFSRNHGMKKAKGDYFSILDSDVLIDNDFVKNLNNQLANNYLDCYGGPDKLHPASSPIQKAINYCLTSIFTTGGIRGNKNHVGKFYPRSFNMGFSRKVFEATNGFKIPFFGEDIELSARIMDLGYTTGLYEDVYVYHKRKTNFIDFFKQMHFFGRARINIYSFFPKTLKIVHFFPAAFFLFLCSIIPMLLVNRVIGSFLLGFLFLYLVLVFFDAFFTYKNFKIALLCVPGVLIQMSGYGTGFIKDFTKRVIFGKDL